MTAPSRRLRSQRQHRHRRTSYPREAYDGCGTVLLVDEDYMRTVNGTAIRRCGWFP